MKIPETIAKVDKFDSFAGIVNTVSSLLRTTLCSPLHSATSKNHREARKLCPGAFESIGGNHS